MRDYGAQSAGRAQWASACWRSMARRNAARSRRGKRQGEATLAVYDPEREQVIAQVAIRPEQGEIPAGPAALGQVALKDKVVLADALHTQRKLCQQVLAAGGDYLLTVKENQPLTLPGHRKPLCPHGAPSQPARLSNGRQNQ